MNPPKPPLPLGVRRVILARASTPGSPIVVTPVDATAPSKINPSRNILISKTSDSKSFFKPKVEISSDKVIVSNTVSATVSTTVLTTVSTTVSTTASSTAGVRTQEFAVRIPKAGKKHISLLRFVQGHRVDFGTGVVSTSTASVDSNAKVPGEVILQRENNQRVSKYAEIDDQEPRFGEGSEYRRAQRAEAKSKFAHSRKSSYHPLDQPLLLSLAPHASSGNKTKIKRYRGTKEGSIAKNVNYFVFVHNKDGSFDAFPVHDWYNMTPEIKYKHLNIEEAEEEFSKRNKTLNQFNIMVRKRMTQDQDEDNGAAEDTAADKMSMKKMTADNLDGKRKTSSKERNFLLTDLEDASSRVLEEDDDLDSDDGEADKTKRGGADADGDESDGYGKNRRAKGVKGRIKMAAKIHRQKKKRGNVRGSDSEADDDSELDDHEGDDVDYMTHSSSDEEKLSDSERAKIYDEKGMDEEGAVKGLLVSESEQDDDEDDEETIRRKAEASKAADDRESDLAKKNKKKKKMKKGKGITRNKAGGAEECSSGSSSSSSSSVSSSESGSEDKDKEKSAAKSSAASNVPAAMSASSLKRFSNFDSRDSIAGASDLKRARTQAPPSTSTFSTTTPTTSITAASSTGKPSTAAATITGSGVGGAGAAAGTAAVTDINEETIMRYLRRKPMTAKDLLRKFRAKSLPLRREQLAERIATVLKGMERRIEKKNNAGTIYLSLKS